MMTSPSRTTPACRTGIAEPERDDELRRTGLGSDGGGGGGSSARLSAGMPRAKQPRSDDGAHDDPGDEADPPGEGAHRGRRRHRYASSKTSTGVPCSAKPKSIWAS